jgi:hypothetical protein
MQTAWHHPGTIIQSTMFCLFFVMASIMVITVLFGAFVSRSRSGPSEPRRRWEKIYLIATVLLGWCTAVTGTFWVYPRQLIELGSESVGLQSRTMESKELIAWIAAMVITMLVYVLIRYKGQVEEHRRIRRIAAVFALIALSATGIANGIGGLIHT